MDFYIGWKMGQGNSGRPCVIGRDATMEILKAWGRACVLKEANKDK